MTLLEDRLIKIIELRQLGFDDEKISNELNLSKEIIKNYEKSTKNQILKLYNKKNDYIAKKLNLSPILVDLFINQYDLNIKEKISYKQKKLEIIINKIDETINEGAKSIEEIAEKTGVCYNTILNYRKAGYIEISKVNIRKRGRKIDSKEKQERDKLINEGYAFAEIGRITGRTGEAIRHYARVNDLYEIWKKAKEKRKLSEIQLYQNIVYILEERAEQLAREKGWEYKKATEFIMKKSRHKNSSLKFENLLNLFKKYKLLKDEGEKMSFKELADYSGLHYARDVGYILREVGLESLYWTCKTNKRNLESKKEIIKKFENFDINNNDLAYFLEISEVSIGKIRQSPNKNFFVKSFFRANGSGFLGSLTYRLASQIYEAQDLGFKKEEICDLLETKKEIVNYAFLNKENIEPKVIEILKKIYPNKEIKKPYK